MTLTRLEHIERLERLLRKVLQALFDWSNDKGSKHRHDIVLHEIAREAVLALDQPQAEADRSGPLTTAERLACTCGQNSADGWRRCPVRYHSVYAPKPAPAKCGRCSWQRRVPDATTMSGDAPCPDCKPAEEKPDVIRCDYGEKCPGHATETDPPCEWDQPGGETVVLSKKRVAHIRAVLARNGQEINGNIICDAFEELRRQLAEAKRDEALTAEHLGMRMRERDEARRQLAAQTKRLAALEAVAKNADALTDCMAEFPDGPQYWGEYVQTLDEAIAKWKTLDALAREGKS